jgi:anti-anti-sigma factor
MTPIVAVTTAFLNAMKCKDLSEAPLADNIIYHGPLSGESIHGRKHVTGFLSVYLPVINDLRIVRQIAEGDYVATVWEAETSFGLVSLVYVFCVKDGQIVEIQAFYDPRGFLERMGRWTGHANEEATMHIELSDEEDVRVVRLSGRLVSGPGVDYVHAKLSQIKSGSPKVLVDLRELVSIGSMGVGFLASLHTSVTMNSGGRLVLVGPSRRVREVLDLTRLSTVIPIEAALAAGMASLRADSKAASTDS